MQHDGLLGNTLVRCLFHGLIACTRLRSYHAGVLVESMHSFR